MNPLSDEPPEKHVEMVKRFGVFGLVVFGIIECMGRNMKFRNEDGLLRSAWLWTILIVSLMVVAIARAATPDQIQSCSTLAPSGYTGSTLVGCPVTNVGWGPALTTNLVRTITPTGQGWVAFNKLTPSSSIVRKSTGKWDILSNVTLTPAPTAPAPPVVTPPPPPPADVTVSVDGALTYEPVVYSQLPSGACFTLTGSNGKTAHVCLPQ